MAINTQPIPSCFSIYDFIHSDHFAKGLLINLSVLSNCAFRHRCYLLINWMCDLKE